MDPGERKLLKYSNQCSRKPFLKMYVALFAFPQVHAYCANYIFLSPLCLYQITIQHLPTVKNQVDLIQNNSTSLYIKACGFISEDIINRHLFGTYCCLWGGVWSPLSSRHLSNQTVTTDKTRLNPLGAESRICLSLTHP